MVRIIFLPGLGADHRIFTHQLTFFPNSVVINWILPDSGESLDSYACRLSRDIESNSDPTIVCGLSFGGLVAPWLAHNINADACISISSVTSRYQFPARYYFVFFFLKYFPCVVFSLIFVISWFARMFRPIVFLSASKFYYDIFNQFVDMNPLCTARLIVMMLDWAYIP